MKALTGLLIFCLLFPVGARATDTGRGYVGPSVQGAVAYELVAPPCDCPPKCDCHKPGGTCPGGTCIEKCACHKLKVRASAIDPLTAKPWRFPRYPGDDAVYISNETRAAMAQAEEAKRKLATAAAIRPLPIPSAIVAGKRQLTGYKPTKKQYERAQFRSLQPFEPGANDPLPLEIDYRKLASSVVVQQSCGDCWAQGAKSASQYIISFFDKKSIDTSAQAIIDCSGYGSCGGGGSSMGFFTDPKGIVYTSDYKYAGRTQRCDKSKLVLNEKMKSDFFLRGASGGKPTVQDLQRSIVQFGPHEVCGASGALGSGGVVQKITYGREDHCYSVVGYLDGKTQGWKDGVYWIIHNSWGYKWGDKGFGYYLASTDGVTMMGNVINEMQGVDYKPLCPVIADAGADQNILVAPGHPDRVQIGIAAVADMSYSWSPTAGLSDPTVAQPFVIASSAPKGIDGLPMTTVYTVTATNSKCGAQAKSMTTVHIFNQKFKADGSRYFAEGSWLKTVSR